MTTRNQIVKRLVFGCAGVGVLAFALVASPARAVDPSADTGSAMPKAEKAELINVSAEVLAIDKSGRKLTIKKPDGEKVVIRAPAGMKSFDKLKVGDKIDVDYLESVAIGILPPGSKPSVSERTAVVPPGTVGRELSVSTEVVSVDAANNKVTLKGPKGMQQTLSVQNPELQAMLPTLKPGQAVVVQFIEAMAVRIQPPGK